MFTGLLLSRDDGVIRLFRRTCAEMGVGLEVCTGAEQALGELSRRKFEAVMIDCDDVHGACDVLQSLGSSPANRRSAALAILNGVTTTAGAFASGAGLTVQKPISSEHARTSLRTILMLVQQEHRRYHRVPLDIAVNVTLDGSRSLAAKSSNISEGGMALRLERGMPEHRSANLNFTLPGSSKAIEVKAAVAWVDPAGSAGVRFDYMSKEAKQELGAWLDEQIGEQKKPAVAQQLPLTSRLLR